MGMVDIRLPPTRSLNVLHSALLGHSLSPGRSLHLSVLLDAVPETPKLSKDAMALVSSESVRRPKTDSVSCKDSYSKRAGPLVEFNGTDSHAGAVRASVLAKERKIVRKYETEM